jgi:hypothetical protein
MKQRTRTDTRRCSVTTMRNSIFLLSRPIANARRVGSVQPPGRTGGEAASGPMPLAKTTRPCAMAAGDGCEVYGVERALGASAAAILSAEVFFRSQARPSFDNTKMHHFDGSQ